MSPAYKKGDVVQLREHYKTSYLAKSPMIVLGAEYWTHDVMYVYELLSGDDKIFLYERCVELVK